MNSSSLAIDARRVRQLFARPRRHIAGDGADNDFVIREIGRRMAERLDYIKIDPVVLLDAGCGAGADLAALARRFPKARCVGVDQAWQRLARPRRGVFARWLARQDADRIGADFSSLPLAAKSLDLVWSNLALHWHAAPHTVLPEWRRVLKVGGLVMFSTFGPDTLKEVRAACAAAGLDDARRVMPFTDLHDYGDMLVEAGFATPVMDMEPLTLTYASAADLWRDVRGLGGNAATDRARGLLGRVAARRLDEALAATRDADGRYRLSFEIVYGHAWNPQPKVSADGRAIIRFDRPGAGR